MLIQIPMIKEEVDVINSDPGSAVGFAEAGVMLLQGSKEVVELQRAAMALRRLGAEVFIPSSIWPTWFGIMKIQVAPNLTPTFGTMERRMVMVVEEEPVQSVRMEIVQEGQEPIKVMQWFESLAGN